MISSPIPQSIELGSLTFYTYGAILGFATFVALWGFFEKSDLKIKTQDFVFVMLSGLVGARILFLAHNWEKLMDNPLLAFKVWDGGLAFFGGIIAIFLTIYVISRIRHIDFLKITDTLFLYLPLGQAIGRYGNFVNNELYGYPTDLPWGVYIPLEDRITGYAKYSTFHPTFLYESILSLISFGILYGVSKKWEFGKGLITAVYFINYGIIRLLVNRFRIDKEYFWFIETSDLFAIFAISAGILALVYIRQKK